MTNLQLRSISALFLIPFVFGAIIKGGVFFAVFVTVAFIASLYEWISLSLKTNRKIISAFFGLIYLPVCFYEFYLLRTGFADGLYLVLTMMVVIWSADTGAYFVGRKYGKHKMAPTISPNKSWEGMAGAIVFAGLALMLMVLAAPHLWTLMPNSRVLGEVNTEAHPFILCLMGGLLGYIGQAGDLMESFLKRKAGAKDSSKLIPGHGGVLDRVDSLLLVAPFFVLIATHVL